MRRAALGTFGAGDNPMDKENGKRAKPCRIGQRLAGRLKSPQSRGGDAQQRLAAQQPTGAQV